MSGLRLAVVPHAEPTIVSAALQAGAVLVSPPEAEALVWTDPIAPIGLKDALADSPARWIQLPFAGIEAFVETGVVTSERTWTCAKGIYGPSTAEHALTLMLAAARRVHEHVRRGSWSDRRGLDAPERRLTEAVVVLLGTGGIGRSLTAMLAPLGARVIAVNRSGTDLDGAERTITSDRLQEVLPEADFLVVAAALTAETKGLIGAAEFACMDAGAWLVNVARGAIVDHDALVEALRAGHVGGAALDVTEPEPLPDGHPLWSLENVIITPHVANTWRMALPELGALVERNVRAFSNGGALEGLVDPALGY